MPQVARTYCTRCQRSVYNVMIDGIRVPLLFYFVVGISNDGGEPFNINGEGVKVPSFVREICQTPLQRIELCMQCVSEVFGLPLTTAADDEFYDAQLQNLREREGQTTDSRDVLTRYNEMHARTLAAVTVARGVHTKEEALATIPTGVAGGTRQPASMVKVK